MKKKWNVIMDKYGKYENKYGTDKYEIRFYKYENGGNQIPINTKMEIFSILAIQCNLID